jgi:hypothetical protein
MDILKNNQYKNLNISNLDLRGVNLSFTDFQEVDLINCDLTGVCLDGANLTGANLTGTRLDKSSLIGANLNKVNLVKATLTEAKLIGSFFLHKAVLNGSKFCNANLTLAQMNGASLIDTDLRKVCLNGAILIEANLCGANLDEVHIEGTNFQGAFYNKKTKFPSNFDPIVEGMKLIFLEEENLTFEDVLDTFNYVINLATSYLGTKLTDKYLNVARPQDNALNIFQLDKSCSIACSVIFKKQTDKEIIKLLEKWFINFIYACSQIIQDFYLILDRRKIVFDLSQLDKISHKIG